MDEELDALLILIYGFGRVPYHLLAEALGIRPDKAAAYLRRVQEAQNEKRGHPDRQPGDRPGGVPGISSGD